MYITTIQNDNEGIRLPWSLIGGLGRETLVSSCWTSVLLSKASTKIEPGMFQLGSVRHYLVRMVGEPGSSLVGIGAVKKEIETEHSIKHFKYFLLTHNTIVIRSVPWK